jgi:hypothetical protein
MSVEFIGYIGTRLQSEIIAAQGPVLDPAHVEQAARIHEDGGFDRALVAFHSTSPESILACWPRGLGHPAPQPAHRPPARLHRTDPAVRDLGCADRRPHCDACHHRRQRPGTAPGWQLHRQG